MRGAAFPFVFLLAAQDVASRKTQRSVSASARLGIHQRAVYFLSFLFTSSRYTRSCRRTVAWARNAS